jgi:cysteine synthase A
MADIKSSIVEVIGRTPLLRINSIGKDLPGNIAAKLEFQNPMRSIKDRAALAMIENAEMRGLLKKGSSVIEATSGNTGVALAFICAAKKYPLTIVMPEYANRETIDMLKAMGATVHLTHTEGLMKGAIEKALELKESIPNAYMPMQFDNPSNPKAHFDLTGPEIWEATDGEVHTFIAGVGTGGTITGVGQYLKARKPSIQLIAVEPKDSAVISGEKPGHHHIQGIGAGFIPRILEVELLDEVITIEAEEAKAMCIRLAREEGMLVGISSGANLAAAAKVAAREDLADQLIVTVLCDTGERYLSSKLFTPS